jgi:hypothetical protein
MARSTLSRSTTSRPAGACAHTRSRFCGSVVAAMGVEIVLHPPHCRETPMPDPLARLQSARDEIDRVFGSGYAQANPDVVSAVMISASLDFHGLIISRALEGVAGALFEDEVVPAVRRAGILR